MSQKPDYYALLGIFRDATQGEIKRAYFKAAQRLHPDKNKAPGETEFFLDIQQGYEILSDPEKRAEYDAKLSPEETLASPITERIFYSRQSLVHLREPQLLYTLLEWKPRQTEGKIPAPPLNICIIIDRSTSMQGQKMDMVKAATTQLMRSLRQDDIFGVVTFSDRADVVIPASYQANRNQLESRIQMIQPSGGTEMFQGLEAGVNEVRSSLETGRVNQIILLTDGHTYGDEQTCLSLAKEIGNRGINISAFGIGKDWNDSFLDSLANSTGGNAMYVADPQDIQKMLAEKFKALVNVYADEAVLEYNIPPGVDLTYAFRMLPESSPLTGESPMHLGPILQDTRLSVLLEFRIQPSAVTSDNVKLFDGLMNVVIPSRPTPIPPLRIRISRPVTDEPIAEPPSSDILHALSRMNLYRMQEIAQQEVDSGKYAEASRRLQHLATHLLESGERGLARTVLLEAENIIRKQSLTADGRKEIKYGTRALLLSGEEELI